MRRLIFILIVFCRFNNAIAQPSISPNPQEHIGDTITVTGRIYAGYFLKHVITMPTFLNLYDSSPMHQLMLRIDSGDRKNFPMPPEKYYYNKKVSITGIINDYKGTPLIKIIDTSNIKIDMNDNGPEPVTSTGSFLSGREFNFGKDTLKKYPPNPNIKSTARPQSLIDTVTHKNIPVEIKAGTEPIDTAWIDKVAAAKMAEEKKEKKTNVVKAPVTDDILIDGGPDKVRTIKLRNMPVAKSAVNNTSDSTSAKAQWLKTISNQQFDPVISEVWSVQGDNEIDMRTSPTSDAPVIAYLMKQMTVLVTYKSKKWSYVTVQNPDGSTGMNGFIKNRTYRYLQKK